MKGLTSTKNLTQTQLKTLRFVQQQPNLTNIDHLPKSEGISTKNGTSADDSVGMLESRKR